MKYPECSVFATNYEFKNEKGEIKPTIINKLPFDGEDGVLSNYFEVASCSNSPLWTSAVVAKKEAFQSVGGFPLGIRAGEDLLTWARLASKYEIAYFNNPLAIFNVETVHVSGKPKRIPSEIDEVSRQLLILKKKYSPPFINDYISLWHKMRSSIYMRLRMRKESIKEAFLGLRYNPGNYKLYFFILINLMPAKLQPF